MRHTLAACCSKPTRPKWSSTSEVTIPAVNDVLRSTPESLAEVQQNPEWNPKADLVREDLGSGGVEQAAMFRPVTDAACFGVDAVGAALAAAGDGPVYLEIATDALR